MKYHTEFHTELNEINIDRDNIQPLGEISGAAWVSDYSW
jgi:hypothetical protein